MTAALAPTRDEAKDMALVLERIREVRRGGGYGEIKLKIKGGKCVEVSTTVVIQPS